MTYRSAARTDVGKKREHNEDSFLVNEDLGLFVVCDGMGGHAGGETASRLAAQTLEQGLLEARRRDGAVFAADVPLAESGLAAALREAVEGACSAVFHAARTTPALAGMGTTCVALVLRGGHALIAHVGDSRVYLVRDGRVHQLTEDHSLVNEQVRAGLLTPEEARHSRLRNIITRSVGFEEEVLVDVLGVEVNPGDRFVLCSDGLSNLVEGSEMASLFADEPARAAEALVQLANDRGGDDNITVVAVELLD